MNHISLTVKGIPDGETREMLIAWLYSLGYESFNEEEGTIEAYIEEEAFDDRSIVDTIGGFPGGDRFSWDWCKVSEKNWNAEWEKDYQPVLVAGSCNVRAPFHSRRSDVRFDIVIAPKMSFGTAHHETTRLMIESVLETPMKGATVIDMGCGTGVLAILANKLGAVHVYAIDNNEWAVNNARENVALNNAGTVEVLEGDAGVLANLSADVILANINRNVLMEDMEAYDRSLKAGGTLVMSGFLEHDLDLIHTKASAMGLELTGKNMRDLWVALSYKKN